MLAMTLLADHPKEAASGPSPPDPHAPGTGRHAAFRAVAAAAFRRSAVGVPARLRISDAYSLVAAWQTMLADP